MGSIPVGGSKKFSEIFHRVLSIIYLIFIEKIFNNCSTYALGYEMVDRQRGAWRLWLVKFTEHALVRFS